jgi:ribosomal protein S18 acetylase RimI-like enzyme
MEERFGEYVLTDDPRRFDLDAACGLLRDAYWARGRTREQIARSVERSLVFSVHIRDADRQIAMARVIGDGVTTSYVCDVVVDADHRARGIGRRLVTAILAHPAVRGTRVLLITRDAQPFYRELGFVTHPYECMVLA